MVVVTIMTGRVTFSAKDGKKQLVGT